MAAPPDQPPLVVVSIKPLHSLVAGVMGDVGQPDLLLSGASSPHGYVLKPSDATRIERATRLFWLGPALEGFLDRSARSLGAGVSVKLIEHIKNNLYPIRLIDTLGDHSEPDGAHGDHDASVDGLVPDPHAWLDPRIAIVLVDAIARELATAAPADAARFRANAAELQTRLQALDAEIERRLEPVKHRSFMVFHDAYQYFEARYGLLNAGALSISPESPPGARHLDALRRRLERGEVACVFSEPQFDAKLIDTLTAGTGVRSAALDPLGVDLAPGPEAYFELMRALAADLRTCLEG